VPQAQEKLVSKGRVNDLIKVLRSKRLSSHNQSITYGRQARLLNIKKPTRNLHISFRLLLPLHILSHDLQSVRPVGHFPCTTQKADKDWNVERVAINRGASR